MQQTAKHDSMRKNNTLSVLKCIWSFGPVTKHEIQQKTGLSWGAVSNITIELLSKRIISASRSTNPALGRIPSQYEINTLENLIIGIDLNIIGINVVIIDLKCKVIETIREKIIINEKDKIIEQTKRMVHEIIKKSAVDMGKVIGIGIAAQGVVDTEKGISVFTHYFIGWNNVPLRDVFEKEFCKPVFVEHDPNCMALAERWLSFDGGIKNFLFIRLSICVGLGIIVNGDIYRGADGCAGEFGHITMNPSGGICTCGNTGCLEVYASGQSILQQTITGMKLGRTQILSGLAGDEKAVDLDMVINAARQGDMYIKSLFDDAGLYLGVGISNLINLFNPEQIVIGGELSICSDLFFERVKDTVNKKAWKNSRVNLSISKHNVDSAAIGAATLFIQKFFSGGELAKYHNNLL